MLIAVLFLLAADPAPPALPKIVKSAVSITVPARIVVDAVPEEKVAVETLPDGTLRLVGGYKLNVRVEAEPNPPGPPNPPTPPGPDPKPPGPTPPPPKDELAQKCVAWVALVPATTTKRAEALALAACCEGMASKIAAGGVKDWKAVVTGLRDTMKPALGARLDAWKPWSSAMALELSARVNAGQLPNLEAWATALTSIAAGLRATS